jgi:hypothetical protein
MIHPQAAGIFPRFKFQSSFSRCERREVLIDRESGRKRHAVYRFKTPALSGCYFAG